METDDYVIKETPPMDWIFFIIRAMHPMPGKRRKKWRGGYE
jgi:hypothetical protein